MSIPSATKFADITLLITHYNRSESLRRLLTIIKQIGLIFGEIIVTDDASESKHVNALIAMQTEFSYTLLTANENKGLGHNMNMGHNAVKTPYILYIQEDFVPAPTFVNALTDGHELMEQGQQWDIVRFYSFPWAPFPYLKNYGKGFSEMRFSLSPWYINHIKFFVYSDHPHLKRSSFTDKFGRYLESVRGDVTEKAMCRAFLKKEGKGLYFSDYKSLFVHVNDDEEQGQFRPEKEKTKKLTNIRPLYWMYLKFKSIKETISFYFDKNH